MAATNVAAWPKAISAITLFVEDLAATKAFYREVFGLPVAFEDDDSAVFMFGETAINLLDVGEADELIEPAPVASPERRLAAPVHDGRRRRRRDVRRAPAARASSCSTARWTGRGASGPASVPRPGRAHLGDREVGWAPQEECPMQRVTSSARKGSPRPAATAHVTEFSGRLVAVSGQVAWDADGNVVGRDDVEAQARQVFANLRTALAGRRHGPRPRRQADGLPDRHRRRRDRPPRPQRVRRPGVAARRARSSRSSRSSTRR